MDYQKYKKTRDNAWLLLLRHKVQTLPVDILDLCKREGITVRTFGFCRKKGIFNVLGLEPYTLDNDGFALAIGGRGFIFYDESKTPQRQRFTIAHELGHIINGDVGPIPTKRNREPSENDDSIETYANIVAARIMSPSCVLWALKVSSPQEIEQLCFVSPQAAYWRYKRLVLLYEREREWISKYGKSCFLQSPLEQQVFHNFEAYINQKRNG